MDVKVKLAFFGIDLVLPLFLGYLCRYQNRLKDGFFNKMILNNILVVYPVLSFLSFWVLPLTRELVWLPVMGILIGAVPGVTAYFIAERKYPSDDQRGSYVMSASLSNLGTVGGLCVFLIYGEMGYGYQQLVVLFQYILMFLFCYPLAQYYEQRSGNRVSMKRISIFSVLFSRNQIAVLGILSGGALQLVGIPRPDTLDGVADIFVHLGAWTALLPVGYSMNFAQMKGRYHEIADLAAVKFLATPVAIAVFSYFVIDDVVMRGTLLILACCPAAVNAVIIARLYHLDVHLCVTAFIVTTGIFILFVYPLLFFVLTMGDILP